MCEGIKIIMYTGATNCFLGKEICPLTAASADPSHGLCPAPTQEILNGQQGQEQATLTEGRRKQSAP